LLKLRPFIPVLIIAAAGLSAYHNSFRGPFIFDDVGNILENPRIRHLWSIWETLSPPRDSGIAGRPVINLSLAVNYAFGGTRVWGYHALNLAVHILAGLTLFGIVRRTFLRHECWSTGVMECWARFGASAEWMALTVALIWTVHPLQTESVNYIIQRSESMMGLFYLLTLYCFIRGSGSQRPRPWYGLCVTACALGMVCKAVMVSAPLIVLLYDRTFISGSFGAAWRRRRWVLGALAATWILPGYLAACGGSLGTLSRNPMIRVGWREYLLTESGVILQYLRLSAWPHPLCFDYYGLIAATWFSIVPPMLVIAILLAAAVCALRSNSVWGFLGAWFFLILAPTSSFFPLDSPMYEHRMYLPLAAVAAAVVLGASVLGKGLFSQRQGVAVGCATAGSVVVLFSFLTIQRNQVYNSAVSIWQDAVEKCPNNFRAHYNLGNALLGEGKAQEAIGHWEQALRINPDYADAHYNLGHALEKMGRVQEAIWHYEQALRIKPDYAEAHNNLGTALIQLGRQAEAMEHWEQALRIKPDFAEAHSNLANTLIQTGKQAEAMEHWEQALKINPQLAEAHYNLGLALEKLRRIQEAITHYEQAVRLKPDFVEAQNALARARAAQ
jgi:tetratricopeptide (TPR) repeat protein